MLVAVFFFASFLRIQRTLKSIRRNRTLYALKDETHLPSSALHEYNNPFNIFLSIDIILFRDYTVNR